MTIGKICKCEVVIAPKDMSVQEAAKLMKKNNIGDIIIVNDNEKGTQPIGILTDRDITTKIVANDLDAKTIRVNDAMSEDLLILNSHQVIQEAIDMMSAKGVRRAPIVDDQHKIVGIASIDDLLIFLADEISSLAKLVRKQVE